LSGSAGGSPFRARAGAGAAPQACAAGPPSDRRVDRVLVSAEQIAARVPVLAHEIAAALGPSPRDPVLLAVMTGALIFAADLIRHLPVPLRIALATVTSYPGTATSSQGARLKGELPPDLAGRDVLLVDDILDSGRTLRKHAARSLPIVCEHVGFDIPDEFVVGYGLDYDGYYRNLPAVHAMVPATS